MAHSTTATRPQTSHSQAFPGPIVDLISQGIPARELSKGKATVQIWCAIRRTAASAIARGWTYNRWLDAVADDRNVLYYQLKIGNPRKPKAREQKKIYRDLERAWASASNYLDAEDSDQAREQFAAEVNRRSNAVNKLVSHHGKTLNLSYSERSVLEYVAAESRRRGWLKLTLPARVVGDAIGRSAVVAHKILRRLADLGLLTQVSKGRAGVKANGQGSGSAAIYLIPINVGEFFPANELPLAATLSSTYADTRHSSLAPAAVGTQEGRERERRALPQGAGLPDNHG